MLFVAKKDA